VGLPRDPAADRVGELLRAAIPVADGAELEDETRRLMLHLSREEFATAPRHPVAPATGATSPEALTAEGVAPPRRSALRRLFAGRQRAASGPNASRKGPSHSA
jgi:hypothetical protein